MDQNSLWDFIGFPKGSVASGQQYNDVGEKLTVILYTYIVIIIQVHQNRG